MGLTPEARQSLAEQLKTNPLFDILLSEQEAAAVERMVYAKDDQTRAEGALRIQAIRSLRQDCERSLRSTPVSKGAPA